MGKEIERKFLIGNDSWREGASGTTYRQGYLSTVKERTVRVRIINEKGFLTIKGITIGVTRMEFEYEIPASEATEMLDELCKNPIIEKTRYKISHAGLTWEVDEFAGVNQGLIVAEVELKNEDQTIVLPLWVGEEVSGDPRYFNTNLIANPYTTW